MNETRIAIIGGGPMCTYALERLAARFSQCPSAAPVRLSIFERTGRFGAGTAHSDQQPETSFMNRAAGQITFAADESNLDLAPLLPKPERPTFEEWCKRKYAETGDDRFVVEPTDVPSSADAHLAKPVRKAALLQALADHGAAPAGLA